MSNEFEGKKIVLTGTFATMKRSDAKKLLGDIGATVSGSISKNTDILIHGEKAGSKLSKAQALGVTVMTEAEMVAALAGDERVGDRLDDAGDQLAEKEAATATLMKPVLDIVTPLLDKQVERWGATQASLLKSYIKVFAQRPDIVVRKQDWGRPTPSRTLVRWAGQIAPDALALYHGVGPVRFVWYLKECAEEALQSSDGYRGGNLSLLGLESFRWFPRPDWGGHGEYDHDGNFDELQAEGRTVLSYDVGEDRTKSQLVFDDANDCTRHHLGGVEEYITRGAKGAFGWYWPISGEDEEAKVTLLQRSISADTSAKEMEALLVEKGLTAEEAGSMLKWLGPSARILLPKSEAERTAASELEDAFPLANKTSKRSMDLDLIKSLGSRSEALSPSELKSMLKEHAAFLASGGGGGSWQTLDVAGLPLCMYQGSGAEGTQAVFRLKNMDGASLAKAQLGFADLSGLHAPNVDFSGAQLQGCVAIDSVFAGANFDGAQLQNVDFSGAHMAGASFRGADLSGADFEAADLTDADFSGAKLDGARFPGAVLSGAVHP
ncbi:MAG: pentapeptide repeat-containing protein [Polyangiales bacterium]